MSFILGIDTGGTYTDGVVIDAKGRNIVCKAKAMTTKADLTIGIDNCIRALGFDKTGEIDHVSLSTTLATNTIVEGRGADTGLIYMGDEIEGDIPALCIEKISGKIDIAGNETEKLDAGEVKRALEAMRGKVASVAVSGYASVRNPKHELEVKRIAGEVLNVPIVCGHELTSSLGFYQRTVTAVINGRLIPAIDGLLDSIKTVLTRHGINAPVMVVKGDGTLITEKYAKDRPVETILSGPAASIMGGVALTGEKNALIVDMGGTTTDIAYVTGGEVKIKAEGARVGGWLTRVQAADISTFGLGGDSRIYIDKKGALQIGPQKVYPLCMIGKEYPNLEYEMRSFRRTGEIKKYYDHEADCYFYTGSRDEKHTKDLTETEALILEALKEKPHSIAYIAKLVKKDPEVISLDRLVDRGLVVRAGFTPTDILHIKGEYAIGNINLSQKGFAILSDRLGLSEAQFMAMAEREIEHKMAIETLQSCINFEGNDQNLAGNDAVEYLAKLAFKECVSPVMDISMKLKRPVVAIGAPAQAWITRMSKALNVDVIVPENAEVANAYGAAVGQMTEKVEMLISVSGGQYVLNSPWSRDVYGSKDEAYFYAIHEGRKHIEHRFREAGCMKWHIEESHKDIMLEIEEEGKKTYQGSSITITGSANVI